MFDLLMQPSMPTVPTGPIKTVINALSRPEPFLSLSVLGFALSLLWYRRWTKPLIAGGLALAFIAFYGLSMLDHNFMLIIAKPDNIPITIMIFAFGFFLWLSLRQAALNDERRERGEPLREAGADDKVLVWPDLVYTELIALVICTVVMIVWAIMLRAPLEQPANPQTAPNPSKAPWYFLGLQELLVYFDPWIAGVLLPGLIIVGLCAIPYIDKNPLGNGYYTLKERPFAIGMFLFGFIIMWIVLIVLGTFLRGPNWNFFGPYEYWDPHAPAALVNVQLSELFWVKLLGGGPPSGFPLAFLVRELPGFIFLGLFFVFLPWHLAKNVFRKMYVQIGFARYAVLMILLLWMALVPIKMVFRWIFNGKYFLQIPEWFFNI